MTTDGWFYTHDGERLGPFTGRQLRARQKDIFDGAGHARSFPAMTARNTAGSSLVTIQA